MGRTAELARRLCVPNRGPHQDDRFWIDGLPMQSRYFGFPEVGAFVPGRWLEEGDSVTVGNIVLAVRHCPGHAPGRDLP